ncbi:MAG: phosphatidate cytidylyltransferase [Rhodospirillales bacterium]|nr:phosphatidate cytidylyltransferase [Rhodospirillales bacterium]
MFTRVASGIVFGVPALLIIDFGSPLFEIMVATASAILAWEWFRMCGGGRPKLDGIVGVGVLLAAVVCIVLAGIAPAIGVLFAGSLVMMLVIGSGPWLAAGVLYLGLPCLALLWLRSEPSSGREIVLWLIGVVWASDIGAYAAGRLIGGPRLAPKISPNKTWAGLGGGIALAAAASAALAGAMGDTSVPASVLIGPALNTTALSSAALTGTALTGAALTGAMLGATAQAGDLAESWVKRRFQVKDTGTLIPGHGGLLDRVDALLAVVAVVAVIAAIDKGVLFQWL